MIYNITVCIHEKLTTRVSSQQMCSLFLFRYFLIPFLRPLFSLLFLNLIPSPLPLSRSRVLPTDMPAGSRNKAVFPTISTPPEKREVPVPNPRLPSSCRLTHFRLAGLYSILHYNQEWKNENWTEFLHT